MVIISDHWALLYSTSIKRYVSVEIITRLELRGPENLLFLGRADKSDKFVNARDRVLKGSPIGISEFCNRASTTGLF